MKTIYFCDECGHSQELALWPGMPEGSSCMAACPTCNDYTHHHAADQPCADALAHCDATQGRLPVISTTSLECPQCSVKLSDQYPHGGEFQGGLFVDYFGLSRLYCPGCGWTAEEGSEAWRLPFRGLPGYDADGKIAIRRRREMQ